MFPSPIPPHHHTKVVLPAVLHIANLPNARNMVTPPLPHIANSFPLYSNHTVHGVRMRRTSSLLWAKRATLLVIMLASKHGLQMHALPSHVHCNAAME